MRRIHVWAAFLALAACEGGDDAVDAARGAEAGVDGALDGAADAADPDASPSDRGVPDRAVIDAGPDLAPPDGQLDGARPPDEGPPDMAPPDMAPPDMALPDMAPPDMGPPDRCAHARSTCREDADCGDGTCRPLPDDPRAPCVCVGPRPEPSRAFCEAGGPFESECCADADCAPPAMGQAVCMQSVYGPQNDYCGGAAPPEENSCRADACAADTDCPADMVCMPPGAFGHVIATCRAAPCRVDADCDARPGGECRPYFDRCVSARFGCSYADSPCRTDADCPVGRFGDREACVPGNAGDTECREILPAP